MRKALEKIRETYKAEGYGPFIDEIVKKALEGGEKMEQRKTLADGSVLIKTEEGIYFNQIGNSPPLLLDQEEGERLFINKICPICTGTIDNEMDEYCAGDSCYPEDLM